MSRQVKVVADALIEEVKDKKFDLIALPVSICYLGTV